MKISVRVIANSKFNKVEIISENELKVHLISIPEDNKANKELIEILSKFYKVKKSEMKIIFGEKSKNKILEIIKDI